MTDELSDEELAERLAELDRLGHHRPSGDARYYQPLSRAVDDYEVWAQSPEKRIYLGLDVFDDVMRGTAPGETTLFVGYAQSGKTILLTNMLTYNHERSFAWFTPDETRILVLVRLACVQHNVSARTIERGLQDRNPEVRKMLDETAARYPLLGVYEEGLDLYDMRTALDEQEKATQRPVEGVVFDYAALLNHGGDVRGKLEALKAFGKNVGLPMFVVQQTSRSTGRDGERITLDSGEYGGEQQATHMVGVRRKWQYYDALLKEVQKKLDNPGLGNSQRDDLMDYKTEIEWELDAHRNTVTVSLVKNKRPPGDLVEEVDYSIDRDTGRLMAYQLPDKYKPVFAPIPAPTARQMAFGNGGD